MFIPICKPKIGLHSRKIARWTLDASGGNREKIREIIARVTDRTMFLLQIKPTWTDLRPKIQRQLSTEHAFRTQNPSHSIEATTKLRLGKKAAAGGNGEGVLDTSEVSVSLSNHSLSVWEEMGKTHRSYRHSARVHMQNSVLEFLQSPVVSPRNIGRAMELRCCRARARIWGIRALGKIMTELGGEQAATVAEIVLLRLTCKGVGPSSGELGRNKSLYDAKNSTDITNRCKAMADQSSNVHIPTNVIKSDTTLFWQSRGGKRQIKIFAPENVVLTSIQLYTMNRGSYSPKDVKIRVKVRGDSQKRTIKVVQSLPLTNQWNELVSLEEMESFMEKSFGEDYESFDIEHIELDVVQNHQGMPQPCISRYSCNLLCFIT